MKKTELKTSVFQRKNGQWMGYVEFPRERGKERKRKYVYGVDEKDTNQKVSYLKYEIENGLYIEPRKDTLIAFLKDYCEINKNKWEDTTKALYKMYIDVHYGPYFKKTLLKDIKPITLDKFYDFKLTESRDYNTTEKNDIKKKTICKNDDDEPKKRKPMSINTVIKLHKFLKTALSYAVKNDYIKKNPADNVILTKKEKFNPIVYDEKQFEKLLNAVKGTDDEIPIILGAGCGLRRGEVFGLRWKNIDFKEKTIAVETTSVRFDKSIEKKPKTITSKRKIIAPEYVINALQEFYNANLPSQNEKIITRWIPQSYSERFKSLLEKHGLQHIRFHDLRHFNAVAMLKYGVSDKVAAERLGHSQVGTLKNIYQHVLQEMDESAANDINNIFEKKKNID